MRRSHVSVDKKNFFPVKLVQSSCKIYGDDCFSDAFYLAPQKVRDGQDADMVRLGGTYG